MIPVEAEPSSRKTLLDLPTELRQMIFDDVFHGTIVKATSPTVVSSCPVPKKGQPSEPREWTQQTRQRCNVATLSRCEAISLLLVCRQIYHDTRTRFHSRVTYAFPNCLAFCDVVSRWNEDQIRGVKNVYLRSASVFVKRTNMTITSFGTTAPVLIGTTFGLFSPHLQLEHLTLESCIEVNDNENMRLLYDWTRARDIEYTLSSKVWTASFSYIMPPPGYLYDIRIYGWETPDRATGARGETTRNEAELQEYLKGLPKNSEIAHENYVVRHMKLRFCAWRDHNFVFNAVKESKASWTTKVISGTVPGLAARDETVCLVRSYIESGKWSELRQMPDFFASQSANVPFNPTNFPACPWSRMEDGGNSLEAPEDIDHEMLKQYLLWS
ncbi:MAG: hypothetical protein M1831_001569 [Alyxoria varia]|nr:MAG: hypothetical protein M1831_001569 [Alyxoria varia]